MACSGTDDCECGCCSGRNIQTPAVQDNQPGQSSIAYRAGTWSSFKQSMLARLSSADYPALAALKTRSDDDFSIALLDASAVVLDILTFYQERLANESYLRTAGQLRSLTELSRLIAYAPSPGVSASTYVAFTLRAPTGQATNTAVSAVTIPKGTQVQSVPAQGQVPQTFETSADIQAKADWNALRVQTRTPWLPPGAPNNFVYLEGTATQLQPGDSLLLLGVDRESWTASSGAAPPQEWAVFVLNTVKVDTVRNLTYVSWASPLNQGQSTIIGESYEPLPLPIVRPVGGWDIARYESEVPAAPSYMANQRAQIFTDWARQWIRPVYPRPILGMRSLSGDVALSSPWAAAKVFALRLKAKLYGHNAPNPNLFVNPNATPPVPSFPNLIDSSTTPWTWPWKSYRITSATQIDLDAAYSKIVAGSWFALVNAGTAQVYKAQAVQTISRSDFAMSAKVTELSADYVDDPLLSTANENNAFELPSTEVWAQSDQLQVADQPLTYPLYGTLLDLQDLRSDLVGSQVVALFGKRQRLAVATGVGTLLFVPDDGTDAVFLNPGDVLTVTDPAPLPLTTFGTIPDWSSYTAVQTLNLEDANGRTGVVAAALNDWTLAPSLPSDPNVSEYALVSLISGNPNPYPHTQIQLVSALAHCYDRDSTTVNANVARVTHGQAVSEICGSGNGMTPDQTFTLRQKPLTFVQASTPSGRQSSLQMLVNGVAWSEVPSLQGAGPIQAVFATLNQSDGTTDVSFGDGVEGALLPTGQNNIRADYHVGLGSAGNVAAGSLTTLIDRPLGVSAVINPSDATGGQDADTVDDIRASAPSTVLTLGRVVSLIDYENFAASFAGIAKAHAAWVPSGSGHGVFLTVAGVGGVAMSANNPTLMNLRAALRANGNSLIPLTVQSFVQTVFSVAADVKYDPAYQQAAVQAQVMQSLLVTYGFTQRTFGQDVSADEIAALVQGVPGVVAVNVKQLTVVASSVAGDLGGGANTFSMAGWNRWISRQIIVPRRSLTSPSRIIAYMPRTNPQSTPVPAEILVLNPAPGAVLLGVMP